MDLSRVRVTNAAGKLTALGGSAQSEPVVASQVSAATQHVDLAALRQEVAGQVATLCGAEAACITSGAAAGITISIAALICSEDPDLLKQLPRLPDPRLVVIQAGHNINFGADIEQMVFLAGADTAIAGSAKSVAPADIESVLANNPLALLYVQSHHCIQGNRVDLPTCIELAQQAGVPVVVDAAAEDDLKKYIALGADLVTYSGGKAFGGPTSGFIVGRRDLVELCERQFQGIARPMKVSKEQLAGLSAALNEYTAADQGAILASWRNLNQQLLSAFAGSGFYSMELTPDEAGRDFERVAITPDCDCRKLVEFLVAGSPSIRTRNHQIAEQRILIDPRELTGDDMDTIITRLLEFESQQA